MKAVILAAGEGTRMRPLTYTRPKVMLPIANKPILEFLVLELKKIGISEFVFVVNYKKELIKNYFENGKKWNVDIDYIVQKEQLGTANAIFECSDIITDRFMVLNGDLLISARDLKELKEKKRKEEVVLAVKEVENPKNFGVIEVDGNKVTRIIEKPENPKTSLANSGIYIFSQIIFDYIQKTPISPRGEYEITDSIQLLIDSGFNVRYQVIKEWMDIGYPWDLLNANEYLLKNIKTEINGEVESYATLKNKVIIGKGTIIRNGSYIIGPAIIGKNCDIGPNCFIRPSTCIGDNVRIGNAVEVKNSIIMNNTNIGHLSYVGDSIIGSKCNFGAGTKVANLRHDGKNIKVKIKNKLIDTKARKLGVIMADGVHTGINTSINVGVVIEKDTYPGEIVMRNK